MRYFTGLAILLISTAAFSQQAPTQQQAPNEVQNYAPYSIALLPATPGGEVVLPFLTTDNKLAFFPVSQVQQASNEKRLLGRPISYGELIALIGDLQIQVNQLKQENEKLWAVVGKSSTPQTVVVQTPPAPAQTARPNNDALTKYLLLRQLFPSPQPYPSIPVRIPPNNEMNCTTTYLGSTAYTNCH
jgi:hypothetical protein